jgi:hypothetical protein
MATTDLSFQPAPGHFTSAGDPVQVTKVSGGPASFSAFIYQCPFIEDNDGAPMAYGWDRPGDPLQQNLRPHENGSLRHPSQRGGLTNAVDHPHNLWHGHDFLWVGVYAATPHFARLHGLTVDDREPLRDRRGRFPVVQQPGAPAPGYYVSMTAQPANPGLPDWDQRRYWDASAVPYAVYATHDWLGTGVDPGDFGLAIRVKTGTYGGFFFADTRSRGIGECSRCLVRALSPSGAESDPVSFLVFPGSRSGPALGPAHSHITGALVSQLGKALPASNAEALTRFLALGANLNRFEHALRQGARAVSEMRDKFEVFRRVLINFGVQFPTGDFPARTRSYG